MYKYILSFFLLILLILLFINNNKKENFDVSNALNLVSFQNKLLSDIFEISETEFKVKDKKLISNDIKTGELFASKKIVTQEVNALGNVNSKNLNAIYDIKGKNLNIENNIKTKSLNTGNVNITGKLCIGGSCIDKKHLDVLLGNKGIRLKSNINNNWRYMRARTKHNDMKYDTGNINQGLFTYFQY